MDALDSRRYVDFANLIFITKGENINGNDAADSVAGRNRWIALDSSKKTVL